MFDYLVLQIIYALFFMLILAGVTTAVAWCEPTNYRRRPVLFVISALFSVFGIYSLVSITNICTSALSPGDDFVASASNLFGAFYENFGIEEHLRYSSDQISTLIFSGVEVMLLLLAFVLSFGFIFTFFFRLMLRIDLNIKNNVIRYIIIAFCMVLTIIAGIATSQTMIMLAFLVYEIISLIFLVVGNIRLNNYNKSGKVRTAEKARYSKPKTSAGEKKSAVEFPDVNVGDRFGGEDPFDV